MFPLRNSAASRILTPVNVALIALNIAVFAYEISLGPHGGREIARWAMVPADVAHLFDIRRTAPPSDVGFARGITGYAVIFTSMFIHGSIWHLAGNMMYLLVFGAAVEERMGSARYAYFYLLAGAAAAMASVWMTPTSHVPIIGASGAIAGVLGAHLIFFPRARILTIFPMFIFVRAIEIPALIYLVIWFGAQLWSGLAAESQGAVVNGIAWWSHVGGFLFGIAIAPLIAPVIGRRR
jgi:membrane associated rhomboid family serine protease